MQLLGIGWELQGSYVASITSTHVVLANGKSHTLTEVAGWLTSK